MGILKKIIAVAAGVVTVAVAIAAAAVFARGQQTRGDEELDQAGAYDETSAFTEGNGKSSLQQDAAYMAGTVVAGASVVLGLVGLAGDLSETANDQLLPKVELELEQLRMEKAAKRFHLGDTSAEARYKTLPMRQIYFAYLCEQYRAYVEQGGPAPVPESYSYEECMEEELPVPLEDVYEELVEETGNADDEMTIKAIAQLLKMPPITVGKMLKGSEA
jgi:hypothetical protein